MIMIVKSYGYLDGPIAVMELLSARAFAYLSRPFTNASVELVLNGEE